MSDIWIAIILGIVEGITEFLPVSSTGHLILVNEFLAFSGDFASTFDVVIQLGAILSVIVYFRQKLNPFGKEAAARAQTLQVWKKTIAGVLPAVLIGGLFGSQVEEWLFNPLTVSVALGIGGVALILIESRKRLAKVENIASLSYRMAVLIGFIQCLAMIPGTSRSAATIIGAMLLGVSRVAAAEFSFFLAIPTMAGASAYTLFHNGFTLSGWEMAVIAAGFATAFAVALLVIHSFMKFITTRTFKPFGYYRVALGLIVLAYFAFLV